MNNKPNVKVIVAAHKRCEVPKDPMYFPLHVGAEGKLTPDGKPVDYGFAKDNTGENISDRNFCFGSQSGLYWAWKNLEADYLGLVHYRRFFIGKKIDKDNRLNSILTEEQFLPMLSQYKVFVPKKRRYYIETIYSHYSHTLDGSQLDLTRKIIEEKSPEYLEAFDIFMKRTWGYIFNMMILRRDLMDDYCSWLFTILFELYDHIDRTGMTAFEQRFCGRISERLFNVWLIRQIQTGKIKETEIKELPYTEEVNWGRKIRSVLMAKLFGKKYEASF